MATAPPVDPKTLHGRNAIQAADVYPRGKVLVLDFADLTMKRLPDGHYVLESQSRRNGIIVESFAHLVHALELADEKLSAASRGEVI